MEFPYLLDNILYYSKKSRPHSPSILDFNKIKICKIKSNIKIESNNNSKKRKYSIYNSNEN